MGQGLSTSTAVARGNRTRDELIACVDRGKDYYELLDIRPAFSAPPADVINRQFKKYALQFHPDKYRGNSEREKKENEAVFKLLVVARDTLLNAKLKAAYDKAQRQKKTGMLQWMWDNPLFVVSGAVFLVGVAGPFAFQGVTAAVVFGAINASGFAGARSVWRNPDLSWEEFGTNVLLAAAGGAAAGGVGEKLLHLTTTAGNVIEASADAAFGHVVRVLARQVLARQVLPSVTGLVCIALSRWSDPVFAVVARPEIYKELMAKEDLGSGQRHMVNFDGLKHLERARADPLVRYSGPGSWACLKAYTAETELYSEMNELLRLGSDRLWRYANYIHNLRQEILHRGNTLGWCCSGVVWRGCQIPKGQEQLWTNVGNKFLNASFLSASKNEAVARDPKFLNKKRPVLLRIDCSDNFTPSRGLTYAVDISAISDYEDEEEVLFYPFSGFEVLKVERVQNSPQTGGVLTIIHLRVLDTLEVERLTRCRCGQQLRDQVAYTASYTVNSVCHRCHKSQQDDCLIYGCLDCGFETCTDCVFRAR